MTPASMPTPRSQPGVPATPAQRSTPPGAAARERSSERRTGGAGGGPDGTIRHVTAEGVPVFEATYRNGLRQGLCKLYGANGQLLQEAEYEDDVPHGTTLLYVDGQRMCSHQYRRGVLDGETRCYAATGAVCARLSYRDGRLHGKALFFQDDRLSRRAYYRVGRLDGPCEDFDALGRPVQTATYRNGALHGRFIRYWPDGGKMEERVYRAGRGVVAARRFDAQGREIGMPGPVAGGWTRGLEKWVRG